MAELLYQGHGSFRIVANDKTVIYVDPYAGEGYGLPADIVLVTHQHHDHNCVDLPARKPGCVVVTPEEALEGGVHNTFTIHSIAIEAVEAGNAKHDPTECVGYILVVDGVKLYAAGDTSQTRQMETFAGKNLEYALLPCDGIYNMNPAEAGECARLMGAKHNIPIHTAPGVLFSMEQALRFPDINRLIVEPGQSIML